MSSSSDQAAAPEPHFVPGYTGYCPQFKFRSGNTYGVTTHKVLVDPTVNHSERLVLSERSTDEHQVARPSQRDVDVVGSRARTGGEVYRHPMTPGYEGFVPRINNQFGQRYSVSVTEAVSEFERQRVDTRGALQQTINLGAIPRENTRTNIPRNRWLAKNEYKLPLTAVRPDKVAVIRDKKVTEPAITPPVQSQSPYFMDNTNPQKRLKQGTTKSVPFGQSRFGATNDSMTNSALCDFTSNYRKRLSSEWAPVNLSRPDPPLNIQPKEIYHKHIGQVPNYAGHIPGAKFRFKTSSHVSLIFFHNAGVAGLSARIPVTPKGGLEKISDLELTVICLWSSLMVKYALRNAEKFLTEESGKESQMYDERATP